MARDLPKVSELESGFEPGLPPLPGCLCPVTHSFPRSWGQGLPAASGGSLIPEVPFGFKVFKPRWGRRGQRHRWSPAGLWLTGACARPADCDTPSFMSPELPRACCGLQSCERWSNSSPLALGTLAQPRAPCLRRGRGASAQRAAGVGSGPEACKGQRAEASGCPGLRGSRISAPALGTTRDAAWGGEPFLPVFKKSLTSRSLCEHGILIFFVMRKVIYLNGEYLFMVKKQIV